MSRPVLAHVAHEWQLGQGHAVEARRGLDLDDVAAGRQAAQLGRRRQGDEPAHRR